MSVEDSHQVIKASGCVFTILHFLCNLETDPIS